MWNPRKRWGNYCKPLCSWTFVLWFLGSSNHKKWQYAILEVHLWIHYSVYGTVIINPIIHPISQNLSCLLTKPTKWLCAQQRLRSAWASAESEQSSLCALRIAKDPKDSQGPKVSSCRQRRLIRLGKCPGWSESLLGAHAILLVLSWGGSFITIVSLVDTVHQLLKHVYEHWLLPCQTQHRGFIFLHGFSPCKYILRI